MIKFGYTILYVHDVTKSIQFYEAAFGLERKFVTPENDYGELSTGETILAFASKDLISKVLKSGFLESTLERPPFAMEIGLVTEDVHGVVQQAIENGAQLELEPILKPWGQLIAYLRDPDGFLIEICTPVSG
jgi:lactoylglutathione lyase